MPIGDTDFGGIFLPPPGTQGASEETPIAQAQQAQANRSLRDVVSSSSSQPTNMARITVAGDDHPPEPTPEEMNNLATVTLNAVGANRGNPWFSGNPILAISTNMLAMFEALRQSKVDTLKLDVAMIAVTMDLAKSAAEVARAIGRNEAMMHTIEAVSAGINLGAACFSLGMSIGASKIASRGKKGQDLERAKGEQATAESNLKTAEKKLEPFETTTATKKADLKAAQERASRLETNDPSVGTDPNTGKATRTEAQIKAQEEVASAQKSLDDHLADKSYIDAKKEVADARKAVDDKSREVELLQKGIDKDEQSLRELATLTSHMAQHAATLGGSVAKIGLATEKGELHAQQQIIAAVQENSKRIQQSLQESWKSTSEAMQGLIQALQKIEDERSRAMQMTRGG